MLNNSIKHSEELLNDKTRNIPEFKGRNSINSATIYIFYDRIMDVPREFIGEIAVEIGKRYISD